MCGIHGVINLRNYNTTDATKFVSDGFVAGSLRGMDSSGIYQLGKDGKLYAHKEALSGSNYILHDKAKPYLRDAGESKISVCHVRAATRGKVTAANAHPFTVVTENDNLLIGVHNGTLHSWEGKKKKGKDVEVDSEWAFQHIAEEGIDAFKDIGGAFAFVWYDQRTPGKLFMVRNTQRPMHFCVSKDKNMLYFASEAGMLTWLLDRHDIRTEDEIYSLEPMKLYSFDLTGKEISFSKGEVPSFRAPPATATPYHGSSRDSDWGNWRSNRDTGRHWDASKGRYVENAHGYDPLGDDGEWDAWDYSGNNYKARTIERDADGVPSEGLLLFKNVGKILARSKPAESGTTGAVQPQVTKIAATTTATNVNKMLDKVIEDTRKKADDEAKAKEAEPREEYNMPASFYSTSTATQAEQEAARKLGVMGELQWMEGVLYEPETCAVYGELEEFAPGHGRVKYDAELRNMSATHADRRFINNVHPRFKRNGDWVCIIGVRDDHILKKRVMIVAELTEEGQKKLREQSMG